MSNIYRIGVSIAMANGVSPILGVIARDVMGVHFKVKDLEKGFGRLKLAVGGVMAIAAGSALIAGVVKLTDATEDLTREQGKMLAAGISNRDVANATAKAWNMSANIMGSRVSENLAAIAHLRAALGDLHEAERVAPAYQRNAVALGIMTKRDGEGEAYKIAQAIHLSGAANDPVTKKLRADMFSQQMNLYTAMIAAGGGKLSPQDLLQFQKMSGSYGSSLSDPGRANMAGFIQSMGGSRAGTALASLNRALKDGVMQKSTLAALESIGLIDASKVSASSGNAAHGNGASAGGGIRFMPGALANEAQFRTDTAGWVWGTLIPMLRNAGITSPSDQVNWIQHAKLTQNPTRLLSELIRNEGVDRQESANVRQASRADQYDAVMGRDVGANKKALHDAWQDLLTAIGMPMVKPAIGILQALTAAIKGMTQWAVLNPGKIQLIGKTLVVVGAGLVALGVAAVAVAAFAAVAAGGTVGVAVAGVAAVVGAVGAFLLLNWPGIKKSTNEFGDWVKQINAIGTFWLQHPFQAAAQYAKNGHVDPAAAAANSHAPTAADWAKHRARGGLLGGWFSDMAGIGRNPGLTGAGLQAYGPGSVPPPANNNTPVQVNTAVNLDGKQIANVVSNHQARALGQGGMGAPRFDPLATLALPAAGYAR